MVVLFLLLVVTPLHEGQRKALLTVAVAVRAVLVLGVVRGHAAGARGGAATAHILRVILGGRVRGSAARGILRGALYAWSTLARRRGGAVAGAWNVFLLLVRLLYDVLFVGILAAWGGGGCGSRACRAGFGAMRPGGAGAAKVSLIRKIPPLLLTLLYCRFRVVFCSSYRFIRFISCII
ncbi:uncharacterized protein ZBAI_05228 [Zygosaccharomyces bailii ISA1307]|nr:uncharacterized protein ZBAI_05228 [Zygosaccharomyces bailii ISA1307]